jgi:hypothetical protein
LQADIGCPLQAVGDQERMRLCFLVRRRNGVQSPSQPVNASAVHPTGKLEPDDLGVDIPGQEQGGFKDRIIANQRKQRIKFHCIILAYMITYCNEFCYGQS